MRRTILAVMVLFAVGCTDKAKPDYVKCVQADTAGNVKTAWDTCNAAVAADPNSTSGKAAAAKLASMKPTYDKWQADQSAAAAAAASARAQAAAQARAARAQQLRAKITKKYWDTDPDDDCQGKGLPPYRWSYSGGTYEEDREVAIADGCKTPHIEHGFDVSAGRNDYCCPQAPIAW